MNVNHYLKLLPTLLCTLGLPLQSAARPTETVIYNFTGGADGGRPLAGLTKAGDIFYGTTGGGGANGYGAVFSVTADGMFKVLYSFKAFPDASEVVAPLLYADGALYGTSEIGGSGMHGCNSGGFTSCGTVFKVTLDGQESIVYPFGSKQNDGFQPYDTLVELNGMFYGTTFYGGTSLAYGTVFSVTKSGKEKVLHSFTPSDGVQPATSLAVLNGTLYGTAYSDGDGETDCGTAFSITPGGTFTLLHTFAGRPSDGCAPDGTLLPVDGILYGTTEEGGPRGSREGKGVLFSLTPAGTETVVDYFGNGGYEADGNILVKGRFLYGLTPEGGPGGGGSLFRAPLAGGHKASAYYEFGQKTDDGSGPVPGLLRVGNTFYGVTEAGGKYGQGAIFKITQ